MIVIVLYTMTVIQVVLNDFLVLHTYQLRLTALAKFFLAKAIINLSSTPII